MSHSPNFSQPIRNGGPLPPFNERQRLKLLISEKVKAMRGPGTGRDRLISAIERRARG